MEFYDLEEGKERLKHTPACEYGALYQVQCVLNDLLLHDAMVNTLVGGEEERVK